MNRLRLLFLLAALVAAATPAAAHVDITPQEAHDRLAAGGNVVLVDVREYSEFCGANRHVPDAVNLPWTSGVLQARWTELPAGWDLLVICAGGSRSQAAATWLDGQGVPNVYDVQGGMAAWTFEREACPAEPVLFVSKAEARIRLDWVPCAGTQDYDLIEGDLDLIFDAGATVDLGPVACLAEVTAFTFFTEASPAVAARVVFYLAGQVGTGFGDSSSGKPRVPGNCI